MYWCFNAGVACQCIVLHCVTWLLADLLRTGMTLAFHPCLRSSKHHAVCVEKGHLDLSMMCFLTITPMCGRLASDGRSVAPWFTTLQIWHASSRAPCLRVIGSLHASSRAPYLRVIGSLHAQLYGEGILEQGLCFHGLAWLLAGIWLDQVLG